MNPSDARSALVSSKLRIATDSETDDSDGSATGNETDGGSGDGVLPL